MADGFDSGRRYEVGGFNPFTNTRSKTERYIKTPAVKARNNVPYDVWVRKSTGAESLLPPSKKYAGLYTKTTRLKNIPGSDAVYGTRTKSEKFKDFKKWSDYVDEYIQDSNGNRILNPLWSRPFGEGADFNGQKIGYVKSPSKYKAPIDPSLRVNTDSEFLLGQNSANTSYNSDVNARQRNLDLTNLNYGESKLKLAQQRTQDLGGIDQRAARAGVAFSQGRMNARNRYDRDYNDRSQQSLAANTQANQQFYNQNIDADSMRTKVLNSKIGVHLDCMFSSNINRNM
jgi:hypothetical protein